MPIIKSAKKALRSSAKKKVFNDRRRKAVKETVKEIKKFLAAGKKAEAQKAISEAYKALDKAAKTGVIKKNTASRKKSRLMKSIAKA